MEITEEPYQRIAPHFPVQRGNVSIPNLQALNAILYVNEQGFRRVFTRYDKLDVIFSGFILFALICDALK